MWNGSFNFNLGYINRTCQARYVIILKWGASTVVVSILPHAEFGPNGHWEHASHFIIRKCLVKVLFSNKSRVRFQVEQL